MRWAWAVCSLCTDKKWCELGAVVGVPFLICCHSVLEGNPRRGQSWLKSLKACRWSHARGWCSGVADAAETCPRGAPENATCVTIVKLEEGQTETKYRGTSGICLDQWD